jgi:predicted RNase H-like HicB family nuclease
MTKEFNVIIERDEEGFYVASVPELMERIREAIELCLEVQGDVPTQEFIGMQRIVIEV